MSRQTEPACVSWLYLDILRGLETIQLVQHCAHEKITIRTDAYEREQTQRSHCCLSRTNCLSRRQSTKTAETTHVPTWFAAPPNHHPCPLPCGYHRWNRFRP